MRRWLAMALVAALISSGAAADSLFNKAAKKRGSLITDNEKKFEVGDIITMLVEETVDASTQANTDTKKESDVSANADEANNAFLVSETPGGLNIIPSEVLPNWKIAAENEHKGSGKTTRTNKLVMTVACQVTKVYENGNLDIAGQKKVTVNREDSQMTIRGLIRSRDVSSENTVSSNQVANAQIQLKGQGPLWNSTRRGLITRILDWFSPF